jgi:hypothetical protein
MRRSATFIGAVIFAAIAISVTFAQDDTKPKPPLADKPAEAPVADKEIVEKEIDDEISDLLLDRYAAAYVEMASRTALYNAGRVTLAEVCGAITRYSTAGLELAKTPAGRVAVCEQAFKEAKKIEESAEAKYNADVEPVQQMMLATYTRCDMQIKLLKAKKEKAADKSGDESEVPRLIAPPQSLPIHGT